jgi:hypothetical protein
MHAGTLNENGNHQTKSKTDAAESTITKAKDRETNWFDASESIVRPLIDTSQRACKNFLADGSNANQQASKIAMHGGPKEAWEAVRLLEKGSTTHHRPPQELHFRDPNTGNIDTMPEANLEILCAHCHKVYNRDDAPDAPVDFSVLNDIFQRPTLNSLGMPPSTTEIQHHITKLANNKSPGESGIPAEALKALPPDGIEYMHTLAPPRFLGGKKKL